MCNYPHLSWWIKGSALLHDILLYHRDFAGQDEPVIVLLVCKPIPIDMDPFLKRKLPGNESLIEDKSGMMGAYLRRSRMSEKDVIKKTGEQPITKDSIVRDLVNLGVTPGMVLITHSSLSKMGWVSGGAVAVIQALIEVLGKEGTLVMPTHSGDWSDPEEWSNPPVPENWKEIIRQTMPAFDLDLTPTRGIGRIPETFRGKKGAIRSNHPQMSFAAYGKDASLISGTRTAASSCRSRKRAHGRR